MEKDIRKTIMERITGDNTVKQWIFYGIFIT